MKTPIYTPEGIWHQSGKYPKASLSPSVVNEFAIKYGKMSLAMWKNLPYKGCVYFSLALNILLISIILILKRFLPPIVPLFYGLPDGVEQLTPYFGLILAPIIGLVITFVNIFISNTIRDVFLKKALIISSAFISLLLAITITKIILLVGLF